jgi:hypothetical protein
MQPQFLQARQVQTAEFKANLRERTESPNGQRCQNMSRYYTCTCPALKTTSNRLDLFVNGFEKSIMDYASMIMHQLDIAFFRLVRLPSLAPALWPLTTVVIGGNRFGRGRNPLQSS